MEEVLFTEESNKFLNLEKYANKNSYPLFIIIAISFSCR